MMQPCEPAMAAEPVDILAVAGAVLRREGAAVLAAEQLLDANFVRCVRHLAACEGHVIVAGLGKSGLIGEKLSATLASCATPSFYLHATEALHGDLGRITPGDVILALSNSGETCELVRLAAAAAASGATVMAMTAQPHSRLAQAADFVLPLVAQPEACPLGLAPTVSTTVMLAVGDALAMALSAVRRLTATGYARLHPGGSLGRKLQKVGEVMRVADSVPIAHHAQPLHEVLAIMTQTPGRPGAACIVDDAGHLVGLFTDGDLRRLVQQGAVDTAAAVSCVMHAAPRSIDAEARVEQAAVLLHAYHIDQLPVIDASGRPVGLLDVQDLLQVQTP